MARERAAAAGASKEDCAALDPAVPKSSCLALLRRACEEAGGSPVPSRGFEAWPLGVRAADMAGVFESMWRQPSKGTLLLVCAAHLESVTP